MLDLSLLFKNHFGTRLISDNNIRKFSEIHLQRLIANNSEGMMDQIIAETQNAYDQYFGSIKEEDQSFAVQQGLTISVYKVLHEFKRFVSSTEGLIRAQFGKKSEEYKEFIPYGLKEYWHLNLTKAESAMKRFYNATEKYKAVFGDSLKNLAQSLLAEFREARQNQLNKKGDVSKKKVTTRNNRRALEIQLMKNLHYVGYLYPDDENKYKVFFDQSFLRKKSAKKNNNIIS